MMLNILNKKLSESEVSSYLKNNASVFVPPLGGRVDIDAFSRKLGEYAIQFWAYYDKQEVGFMACYFNDPKKEFGYISTISVVNAFQGKGIGYQLLKKAISYAEMLRFQRIRLEVYKKNNGALKFYIKNGFNIVIEKDASYIMEKKI